MEAPLVHPVIGLAEPSPGRLPEWIRVRPPSGSYARVKAILERYRLGTVCREARCPNLSECWSAGTATLMLLGTDCTRRCSFCAVNTHFPNGAVDVSEPRRVASAVRDWGLRYVVLTQVCRDDLADGGAALLAETVKRIREESPGTRVELLIGDLGSSGEALSTVLEARPDVLAHNVESVRRLSPTLRDRRASYDGSLSVLGSAKQLGGPALVTKSSIMLGVGEEATEVRETLLDMRSAGVQLVTLGQYLRPSPRHAPVVRYASPEEFEIWRVEAVGLGFAGAEAGPLVRSSYHAEALYEAAIAR